MANTPTPTAALPAIATSTPDFVFELEKAPCPVPLPDSAIEGENITCGFITVPELHAQPSGKTIDLTVAIIKSIAQPPQPDPLLMLAGGPGSSALNTFIPIVYSPLGESLRSERDIIIVEQRGTLHATPYLRCDEIENMNLDLLNQALSLKERKPVLVDSLNMCYERYIEAGINLSAYNSVENAADIKVVAGALGYDQYNVYGGSYGTMLAQHLMRKDPHSIRSVILDSVAPLRHDPNVLHKAAFYDRSLRLLFSNCAADTACASMYPDLEATLFETVSSLNDVPAEVTVVNINTNHEHILLLTGDKLLLILRDYLYHTQLLPDIPKLITSIAAGDTTYLSALQSALMFNQDFADGMYKSVVCSELVDFKSDSFNDPSTIYPDISRVMRDMLGELWVDTCQVWQVEKLDESLKTSVVTGIPTLLLSGEFDPTTPSSLAYVASERMSHAYPITVPGIAHGALGTSRCATDIMLDFLNNPEIKPGTTCLQELPGLNFNLPAVQEQEDTIALKSFLIETKGIQGSAPEEWSKPKPGLYMRGHSALDPTLLIIDTVPGQGPTVFIPGLQSTLNLETFPAESTSTLQSHDIHWELYRIDTTVNSINIHASVALAQSHSNAYVIVLMSNPEEADWLYKSVFIPVVEALEPVE